MAGKGCVRRRVLEMVERVGKETRGTRRQLLTWHYVTLNKSVALHALGTAAVGNMVKHLANSVGGTSARTGIHTFVTYTSTIAGTVCMQDALRSTADEWISLVIDYAFTLAVATDGIGSTW